MEFGNENNEGKLKKIIIILAILVILLVALSIIRQKQNENFAGIMIEHKDQIFKLSFDRFEKLNRENFVTLSGDEFQGIRIDKILEYFKIDSSSIPKIKFISRDGLRATIKKAEIEETYLVLKEKNNEQYFRLIIPEDEFKQRWIKYVSKIEL